MTLLRPPSRSRSEAQTLGVWAERWCAWVLRLKGYRLVDRNVRVPGGELDLLCQKGTLLVVVEVKHRQAGDFAAALASISPHKQKRLAAAATHYLARHPQGATLSTRFDAMVVLGPVWQWGWRTHHIQDAFRPN